jgi:hypothetical protein
VPQGSKVIVFSDHVYRISATFYDIDNDIAEKNDYSFMTLILAIYMFFQVTFYGKLVQNASSRLFYNCYLIIDLCEL